MIIINKALYLLPIPIILNSIFNFFKNEVYLIFDKNYILFVISTISYVFVFYFVGKTVSDALKLNLVSAGFSIFLISFFIFDHFFLYFTKNLQFKHTYLLVIFLWLLYFIYKKIEKKELFRIILLFLLLNYFNIFFLEDFKVINNPDLNSDLKHFWLPTLENIYYKNYFFALENNIIEGYGLVINYLQAVLFKIGFFGTFSYNTIPITAFFLFSTVFFWELKISKVTKIYTILFFVPFILNSEWLRYLFVESLMSESVIGFIFAVLVYEVINQKDKIIIYLFLGALMLSKQFVILLTMLFSAYCFIKTKNIFLLTSAFAVYMVDKFNFIYFIKAPNANDYYESITFKTFLSDAEYGNVIDILRFLYIDKTFIYIMLCLGFILLVDLFKNLKFTEIKNLSIFLFLFNFFLVLVLYSTVWRDATFQSSYRYILNTIYFAFMYIALSTDEKINFKSKLNYLK